MKNLTRTTKQLRFTNLISLTSYHAKPFRPSIIQLPQQQQQRDVWTHPTETSDIDHATRTHPFPHTSLPPSHHDHHRSRPHPRLPININPRPLGRMPNSTDTILLSLLSSNVQWANQVKSKDPDFFLTSSKVQTPKILWIGCADSRVPESVLTASKPGDILVHRNIANQFHPNDTSALSILQFAVEIIGVEHVIIAGHTNCGGAQTCYDLAHTHSPTPSPLLLNSPLGSWLSPLISLASELGPLEDKEKAVMRLMEENVKRQVSAMTQSETIKKAWSNGKKVQVHGWVYALETGLLRDLEISQGPEKSRA